MKKISGLLKSMPYYGKKRYYYKKVGAKKSTGTPRTGNTYTQPVNILPGQRYSPRSNTITVVHQFPPPPTTTSTDIPADAQALYKQCLAQNRAILTPSQRQLLRTQAVLLAGQPESSDPVNPPSVTNGLARLHSAQVDPAAPPTPSSASPSSIASQLASIQRMLANTSV